MTYKKLEAVCKKSPCLIPYLTFGDPSIAASELLIQAAIDGGASVIELGIPFSDPIADGPVIQASHQRALLAGEPTLDQAFKTLEKFRYAGVPFLFMLSVNLILNYGEARFFEAAAQAGLSGVVVPDVPVEECDALYALARHYQIAYIQLVSPLSSEARIQKIVKKASGFVYLISSQGITGARETMDQTLKTVAQEIQRVKPLPVIVGFGVSTPEHVKQLTQFAQGVIVGSHLIQTVEPHFSDMQMACRVLTQRLKDLVKP